jgi:hypothetical protein
MLEDLPRWRNGISVEKSQVWYPKFVDKHKGFAKN